MGLQMGVGGSERREGRGESGGERRDPLPSLPPLERAGTLSEAAPQRRAPGVPVPHFTVPPLSQQPLTDWVPLSSCLDLLTHSGGLGPQVTGHLPSPSPPHPALPARGPCDISHLLPPPLFSHTFPVSPPFGRSLSLFPSFYLKIHDPSWCLLSNSLPLCLL